MQPLGILEISLQALMCDGSRSRASGGAIESIIRQSISRIYNQTVDKSRDSLHLSLINSTLS